MKDNLTYLKFMMVALAFAFVFTSCDDDENEDPEAVVPTASFSVDNEAGSLDVTFTSTSENAESLSWDLGDGTTATTATVDHTYSEGGSYTVVLTATSSDGTTDSAEKTVAVSDDPDAVAPVAELSVDVEDLTVTITNTSTDATSFLYSFGDTEDNSTDLITDQDTVVTYTYAEAGDYTIVLTAKGADNLTSTDEVDVTVTAPIVVTPSFTHEVADGDGLTIVFTNTSTVDGEASTTATYSWDFGDGVGTSTEESPTYAYTEVGDYDVVLTVTEGDVSESVTVTVAVVKVVVVDASFSADADYLEVSFTNGSTVDGEVSETATYSWDFGDGVGTSTEENPTYTYAAAGAYTVVLTVTDGDAEGDEDNDLFLIAAEFVGFYNGDFDLYGSDSDDYQANNDAYETPDFWEDDENGIFTRAAGMSTDGQKIGDDKTNGLKDNTTERGFYQEIYVEIGTEYEVSFVSASKVSPASIVYNVWFLDERITKKSDIVAGNTLAEFDVTSAGDGAKNTWSSYSTTFTATTNTVVLFGTGTALNTSDTYFDNFSIVEVEVAPE